MFERRDKLLRGASIRGFHPSKIFGGSSGASIRPEGLLHNLLKHASRYHKRVVKTGYDKDVDDVVKKLTGLHVGSHHSKKSIKKKEKETGDGMFFGNGYDTSSGGGMFFGNGGGVSHHKSLPSSASHSSGHKSAAKSSGPKKSLKLNLSTADAMKTIGGKW